MFPSNGNKPLNRSQLAKMEADAAVAIAALLKALRIEPDHNTQDTPKRVAKMYVREIFSGRYQKIPKLTDFPNVKRLDELYTLGPFDVRSACAHHLCPIEGKAWIGVIPGQRLVGISKFARLTHWIMARPQIQEEATVQLADIIEKAIAPRGLCVVVRCRHACMTWRGVKESASMMTTSVLRGIIKESPPARAEFLKFVNGDDLS